MMFWEAVKGLGWAEETGRDWMLEVLRLSGADEGLGLGTGTMGVWD